MQRLRSHLTYANVMVTVLAFIVLCGGTAVALDGQNTVFGDDIVNGEVQSPDILDGAVGKVDLRNGSINSSKVKNNGIGGVDIADNGSVGSAEVSGLGGADITDGSLTGDDIADTGLTGADTADDSLTGDDILESSLGTVPTAADADALDGRDSRDFARFGGLVLGDGTISQGTGFTVTRLGDGEYQVSFPAGSLSSANCPPVATAMVFSGLVRHPQISTRTCSGLGAGSFTIQTVDNDGVPHDTAFVFLAM
jgi:hypothetical protein